MKRTYQVSKQLPDEIKTRASKELNLGYLNLHDGYTQQAKMNFQLTLQYDPNCADAYWGLMLINLGLRNEDELSASPVTYKNAPYLPECQKALQFADDDLRNKYNTLLANINSINEGENY